MILPISKASINILRAFRLHWVVIHPVYYTNFYLTFNIQCIGIGTRYYIIIYLQICTARNLCSTGYKMNICACACVLYIIMYIRVGKENNMKTAKKTAPCARWAWFFRLIGPGKNGAEAGKITMRIYIYTYRYNIYLYTRYIYISYHLIYIFI